MTQSLHASASGRLITAAAWRRREAAWFMALDARREAQAARLEWHQGAQLQPEQAHEASQFGC